MDRWLLMAAALALALLAALTSPTRSLSSPEADTLAADALFADAVGADAPLADRLGRAFRPDPKQPRVAKLKGRRAWRAVGSSPPLPRWVGGLGASIARGETTLARARWGAALAVALALGLLALAAHAAGGAPLGWVALLALALLPGTLDAATGAGYGAASLLAAAALLAAMQWAAPGTAVTPPGRPAPSAPSGWSGAWSGLAVGLALALTWATHPGGFALVVPVFVAVAVALPKTRPDEDTPPPSPVPAPGTLSLPWVPLTLLGAPVVALIGLLALWPALWSHTGKGLVAWATDTWRLASPAQAVAGVVFDQVHGRAPQAWAALYQWTTWTPLPLLIAWLVGLGVTVRAGRRGWWFPVLGLATLLLVAGLNGGLFGARTTLLPMTLAFTAATAAVGIAVASRWLAVHLGAGGGGRRWVLSVSGAVVILATLGPPAYEQAMGGYTPRGGPQGAEVIQPLPVSLLDSVHAATPKAPVAMLGGGTSWVRSFQVLQEDAGVSLRLRSPDQARWVVIVDDAHAPGLDKQRARLEDRTPALRAVAGGVPFAAYDLGPKAGRRAIKPRRPRKKAGSSPKKVSRPRRKAPAPKAR